MVKFNWNQSGMPATLVSRLGQRNELAEIKTVLHDAGSRVMRAVDAEAMAHELMASGSREIVEMVRDLTTSLAHAEKELESANRRYERLTADLARRGIRISEDEQPDATDGKLEVAPSCRESKLSADAEWESWDQKFRSLLG